ncbi:hypothetical protein IQ230_26145 [Gloeocapsopsis crepidinum LEGE 06123]|uniref:Fe/B12 periplasmic-binding domain-containing protein n=1 Tax=Gloeocapsopsis crepidinum LEGE 06123 TaxID=588587 RepID=A0ABR9UZH4_9CHRO|nr:hypothetical protein [Gloeocapsopsis crepidinum]MBE9193724.1 hypothetical protein [Gloeocapsopsis crepidinum LEGE 06123]
MPRLAGVNASSCKAVFHDLLPSSENCSLERGLVLQQHPLWSKLDVVQRGKVYTVNYNVWVAQRNIGGANRILDDLFKYLVEENI